MRLLFGHDAAVAAFVARRIGLASALDFGPSSAIGVVDAAGQLVAGVVYSNYRPAYGSIELSFAASSPKWLTRRLIQGLLAYPFVQLGCGRVTAITPHTADSARRFLETFGFTREGVIREGFGPSADAVVSGLLKAEWLSSRWNRPRVRRGDDPHGEKRPDASGGS